ncbi:hypothetical protein [Paenibacillus wulumuqiensis]|uniref:hypothetical protein n=1 Tax=Paenibacillus wulumuqiensis TaxID=1567107 RepID=UPI000619A5A4|nr:hypothetical protein [Paenibacillus wulumuqiensis]
MNANFGEELTYWYLRLNGFFIVNNFVLHRNSERQTSDSDLLAVRFPHVQEDIGGQASDWDENFFNLMDRRTNIKLDRKKIIGVICEVKTGNGFRSDSIFEPHNLRKSFGRFGFTDELDKYNDLEHNPIIEFDNYQVAKFLISRQRKNPREDCFHIKMIYMRKFIQQRMEKYQQRKMGDRMFFDSSLLQYIIWEEHLRKERLF